MNDPIVEEVRRVRDAHAARFQYDLDAIFQDIKEQERKSGHQFISGVSRPALPGLAPPPIEAAPSAPPSSPSRKAPPAAARKRERRR